MSRAPKHRFGGPANSGRNLTSLQLSLDPTTVELLNDAGAEVKQKLGANLDPYESADSTRIV